MDSILSYRRLLFELGEAEIAERPGRLSAVARKCSHHAENPPLDLGDRAFCRRERRLEECIETPINVTPT